MSKSVPASYYPHFNDKFDRLFLTDYHRLTVSGNGLSRTQMLLWFSKIFDVINVSGVENDWYFRIPDSNYFLAVKYEMNHIF